MPIPPRIANIYLDSCAFDPKYEPEDSAAKEIFHMYDQMDGLVLIIAHSVQKEIDHPNTPNWVKEKANQLIYTIDMGLNKSQKKVLQQIENILAGTGYIENIRQDARHIFEAQEDGSYFVTTDKRILKKRDALRRISSTFYIRPLAKVKLN